MVIPSSCVSEICENLHLSQSTLNSLSPSWFRGLRAGQANSPKELQGSVGPVRFTSDCSEEWQVTGSIMQLFLVKPNSFPKFSCFQIVPSVEDQLRSDHLTGPKALSRRRDQTGEAEQRAGETWCLGSFPPSQTPPEKEDLFGKCYYPGEWAFPSNLAEA